MEAVIRSGRERGEVAVVIHSGRAHGRGVVAVVIRSAWARGERRGREERGMTVDGAERRGGMKQINYQPVS